MTRGQDGRRKDSGRKGMKPSREIEVADTLVRLHQMGISRLFLPAIAITGSDTTLEDQIFLQAVKGIFKEEPEKVDKIWKLMQDLKHSKIDPLEMVIQVKEFLRGHRVLILGLNTFLPKYHQITLPNQKMEYNQGRSFVDKVKSRFQGDEVMYRTFMDKAKTIGTGKSIEEVYQEIAHLFNADHPDLVEEFSYFLPSYIGAVLPGLNQKPASRAVEESSGQGSGGFQEGQLLLQWPGEIVQQEKIVLTSQEIKQVAKPNTRGRAKGKERAPDGTQDNSLPSCNLGSDPSKRIETRMEKRKKDSLELGERDMALKGRSEENKQDHQYPQRSLPHQHKSAMQDDKPTQKRVGLEQSETGKQRKRYQKPLCSSDADLAGGLSKESQLSAILQSGNSPIETMTERCNDELFELDMQLRRAESTIQKVAELVEYIQGPQFKQQMSTFLLEDHLSAVNLKCIQTIYGDYGLEFMDQIRENPAKALPVILVRLKQKHDEWSQVRIEIRKVWAKVYFKS